MPPLPTSLDGFHPLVIHFPIGLLIVAPLFVFLQIVWKRHAFGFGVSALILMALGTISAIVAVESGEAAAQLVERTPEIAAVLEKHAGLAETTRNLFAILAVLYAALLLGPVLLKKPFRNRLLELGFHGAFLIIYLGCMMVLVNAGHNGGRLVHEFGVHAIMTPPPSTPSTPSSPPASPKP